MQAETPSQPRKSHANMQSALQPGHSVTDTAVPIPGPEKRFLSSLALLASRLTMFSQKLSEECAWQGL